MSENMYCKGLKINSKKYKDNFDKIFSKKAKKRVDKNHKN